MRAFFLTTLRQLALAAAAILMTGSALAHSSSNSYLSLSAPALYGAPPSPAKPNVLVIAN